jgi:hypothetical protein
MGKKFHINKKVDLEVKTETQNYFHSINNKVKHSVIPYYNHFVNKGNGGGKSVKTSAFCWNVMKRIFELGNLSLRDCKRGVERIMLPSPKYLDTTMSRASFPGSVSKLLMNNDKRYAMGRPT